MKVYSIIKYISQLFKKLHPLNGFVGKDNNGNCYLDTEVDGKIESYFPGGKSTN